MKRGILGPVDDPQVVEVSDCIRERGEEPVILDLGVFPKRARLSLRDGVPQAGGVDLDTVPAWYVRSLPLPVPFLPLAATEPAEAGQRQAAATRRAYAAGRERRSFVAGFVSAMQARGTVLVNPPQVMAQHFRKLEQLDVLRAAGIPVPCTLATNDPEAVLAFVNDVEGPVVYKPLAGGALCRRITDADLVPDRLARLSRAPVLFQDEIPGTNIRVYVVHGRVVASYEIRSDELDYRGSETGVLPVIPSAAEADACCHAAKACEMDFTGIDLRRRPDGSFAMLECNPSPMFAGIQRHTGGRPVSRALAEALTDAAVR